MPAEPARPQQQSDEPRARLLGRELVNGTVIAISGLGALVWVALLTVSAPGTLDVALTPLQRLAYFAAVTVLSWPLGHAFAGAVFHLAGPRSPVAAAGTVVAAALYAAANMSVVAVALDKLFVPVYPNELPLTGVYLTCFVIAVSHMALIYTVAWYRVNLTLPRAARTAEAAPAVRAAPRPSGHSESARGPNRSPAPFLGRLPKELGRDVIYVKGNGHYLDVVTAAGTGTLLMRMADAVRELGGTGVQAHRSYWIALRHVVALERRDGFTVVQMTGGVEVPVSRTHRSAVQEAVAASPAATRGSRSVDEPV